MSSISRNSARRAILTWLIFGALFVLCGILGYLQFHSIEEVSVASRERLRGSLQASLERFSRDFDSEIAAACRDLLPSGAAPDDRSTEQAIAARFEQWRKTSRHAELFGRIAIDRPHARSGRLRALDFRQGVFQAAPWPSGWSAVRNRIEAAPPAGTFHGEPVQEPIADGPVFELPLFHTTAPLAFSGPFGPRVEGWLIVELNLAYLRETMLPEMLHRYLGSGESLDYQVEIVSRQSPLTVIYQSDPGPAGRVAGAEDATVGLFEVNYEQILRRRSPRRAPSGQAPRGIPGRGAANSPPPGREARPPRPRGPDPTRWQMFVRHRAGSLEAVVARARNRSLAITGGLLLLMVAALAALILFTRRSQKLAELQMDFVAGVSHELRTPLTVIHTAAYNLRGKVASNPAQVERYGALIQQESGRLSELVGQVLRFARAQAGPIVHNRKLLRVETIIEETLQASQSVIESSRGVVEREIAADLPDVLGDATALKHALENLVSNAAKYGTEADRWIGIFASKVNGSGKEEVEIRVADRGPGIPEDEQARIFDPFFRGRRAIGNQVHGSGLGLNLTKKIVEAHGGRISVRSRPAKGTEFIVRIPAAPAGTSR